MATQATAFCKNVTLAMAAEETFYDDVSCFVFYASRLELSH